MTDKNKNVSFTSAQTDTESGNENLSSKDDIQKSLQSLKIMYQKGFIQEVEYQKRKHELEDELKDL